MKTAKDIMKAIENGQIIINKIVRETVDGPHIWGRNAFEYTSYSKGFSRVKNNALLCLRDMTIAEDGKCSSRLLELYRNCFDVGVSRVLVPNTNNNKWWYVVFFE
jgi:hypothetical protein